MQWSVVTTSITTNRELLPLLLSKHMLALLMPRGRRSASLAINALLLLQSIQNYANHFSRHIWGCTFDIDHSELVGQGFKNLWGLLFEDLFLAFVLAEQTNSALEILRNSLFFKKSGYE